MQKRFIICTLHKMHIRLIKSRIMRWAGYVASRGEMKKAHKIFVGKS